jgi:putative transposase
VVAIEPVNKEILPISISKKRSMFVVAERFLPCLLEEHRGTHCFDWRWNLVPTSMQIPKVEAPYPSPYEKSIVERTVQYIKDRTESFDDDYLPCKRKKCKLRHVINWLNLFADFHNGELRS